MLTNYLLIVFNEFYEYRHVRNRQQLNVKETESKSLK